MRCLISLSNHKSTIKLLDGKRRKNVLRKSPNVKFDGSGNLDKGAYCLDKKTGDREDIQLNIHLDGLRTS